MKKTLIAMAALAMGTCASAQPTDGASERLDVKPLGILHVDAGTFAGESHRDFHSGVALSEARLGGEARYGKWRALVLVGFAYNKVALKDAYVQYNFNSGNLLRAGHLVHHYGYQNSSAAYDKPTMLGPVSESLFNHPQRLGLMYLHAGANFFGTASIYTEGDAVSKPAGGPGGLDKEGLGLKSRLEWHPVSDASELVVQAGVSGLFETPQYGGEGARHDRFSFSANFPTRINSIKAVGASIDRCRNRWEISPDFLLAKGRLALETQYYLTRVNRLDGLKHFCGQGAYANLRGILMGSGYEYASSVAGLANPKPGTLEGILSYDWIDLSDRRAGLLGGRMQDVSATFNYYFNPYVVGRLRCGYTYAWDRAELPDQGIVSLQARLQVIF